METDTKTKEIRVFTVRVHSNNCWYCQYVKINMHDILLPLCVHIIAFSIEDLKTCRLDYHFLRGGPVSSIH